MLDHVPWRSKHPLLASHIRLERIWYYHSLKLVWKRQPNKVYETNHLSYVSEIICNGKQGDHSNCKICKMMTSNEYNFKPTKCAVFAQSSWFIFHTGCVRLVNVLFFCFLLVYFEFKKIGHVYNMLLCIELIRRYAR
jgi:hypothetical protein